MLALQELIDSMEKGDTLELPFGGEYHEKITIKKPLTISSVSSPATIVGDAPTVSIKSKNVFIENCIIESRDENGICITVKKECNPIFKNVFIKGIVEGLDEKGIWEYPNVLELPTKSDEKCSIKIIIFCPAPAKIISEISSINCHTNTLVAGINELEISIDAIPKNTYITGDLIIETLKYKLKRKISLLGNTFNSTYDRKNSIGEYLWVCESSKCAINSDLIQKLPKGSQNDPYQFVIDRKLLNCEYYNITVEGLPEGLSCDNSTIFTQINGVTKEFGVYEVHFIFQKDKLLFKFLSKLEIIEKVIVPLKISKIPNPIELTEGKSVNLKIEIFSSNAPDVTYINQNDFPEGIYFDELSGKISGKISKHGKYNTSIKINDGTNELIQPINFYVKPKTQLTIDLEKKYQFYKDDEFDIHLPIYDSKRLKPVIKLSDQYLGQITIAKDQDDYYLRGKLKEIKKYSIGMTIEDKYKRQIVVDSIIDCIEKPNYTLKWHSKSPIYIKGAKLNTFTEKLKAEIKENNQLFLKFTSVGKWPSYFHLAENGQLDGKIDGKSHQLQIRIEVDDWYCNKNLEIITIVDTSNIVTSSMQNLFSNAFDSPRSSTKTNEGLDIVDCIKTKLASGRVQEHYEDSLLKKGGAIKRDHQFLVKNLPGGLNFNPVNIIIEGTPVEAGVFSLEIYSSENYLLKKIKIEIKNSLFHHDKKTNKCYETRSESGSNRNVLLGNAFLKKK